MNTEYLGRYHWLYYPIKRRSAYCLCSRNLHIVIYYRCLISPQWRPAKTTILIKQHTITDISVLQLFFIRAAICLPVRQQNITSLPSYRSTSLLLYAPAAINIRILVSAAFAQCWFNMVLVILILYYVNTYVGIVYAHARRFN